MGKSLFSTYQQVDRLSGGRLEVLRLSYIHFIQTGGPITSAALAYYALFSLFPLLLFLILVMTLFLVNSDQAFSQAVFLIHSILPVSFSLVETIIKEVLQLRGQISLLGIISLLWVASGFFTTLVAGVNQAWPSVKLRNAVQSRIIALGMVIVLLLLLLLSLFTSILVNLLPAWKTISGNGSALLGWTHIGIVLRLVSALFSFLMFAALYRWVPNKEVHWSAVIKGSIVASIAWEAARVLFALYVGSGLVNYQVVYGSLGALAAMLVWIFLSNYILIFGAHLVSVLDQQVEQEEKEAQLQANLKKNRRKAEPSRGFGIDDPLFLMQPVNSDVEEGA